MGREHWQRVYRESESVSLGWYEADPAVSLDLISMSGIAPANAIADVGCGTSLFVDRLLDRGFGDVLLLDISAAAIAEVRERLGRRAEGRVRFAVDDVTRPASSFAPASLSLWHDRAVLHFAVDEAARRGYVETLKRALRPGGFAIIAAFAPSGAEYCSGLPVQRHDAASITALLGGQFRLLHSRDHTYIQPSGGVRPYVYTLFQRADRGEGDVGE